MAGAESVVDPSDNTQELAELFDATLKFTSVLKKQGVSQTTLTVSTSCRTQHTLPVCFSNISSFSHPQT